MRLFAEAVNDGTELPNTFDTYFTRAFVDEAQGLIDQVFKDGGSARDAEDVAKEFLEAAMTYARALAGEAA